MQNHLKDILKELTERGVQFVICGGVALVLHGVERMTLDLDWRSTWRARTYSDSLMPCGHLTLRRVCLCRPKICSSLKKRTSWLRKKYEGVFFYWFEASVSACWHPNFRKIRRDCKWCRRARCRRVQNQNCFKGKVNWNEKACWTRKRYFRY